MAEGTALFQVGDSFHHELTVTPQVMSGFLALSGDANPMHTDEGFARAQGFERTIVYGNVMGMMVSRLVGMELPTRAVAIARQTLDFRQPAYVGEQLRLHAVVAAVHESVATVQLKLEFHSTSAERICTGQCLVKCL